ncbi:MAG: NUDIX hydrolase [Alphaproteobacteria bacterium]|nr:NUDIX hydrolase [Alphaproteobacteria bacterium]
MDDRRPGADRSDAGREAEPAGPSRDKLRGPVTRAIPEGDTRERLVCTDCGFVNYLNPKIVVGSVVAVDGRYLLCRRAINPRLGYWTLPAGYMETGESAADGARREAWEEARARIAIDRLLAVYDIPRIGQVQLIYRATLAVPGYAPGEESLDVRMFGWDEIPWTEIAFPTVRWALGHHAAVLGQAAFPVFGNPPGEPTDP